MRLALLIPPGRLNGRPPSTMTTYGRRGSMRLALICCLLLAALGGAAADGESDLFTRANFGLGRYRPRRYMPDLREPLWDLMPPPPPRSLPDDDDEDEPLARRLLPLGASRLLTEGAGRFREVVDYERALLRAALLREEEREAEAEPEEEEEEEEEAEPERGVAARFEGAKLVESPDDFAYSPTDPKYFGFDRTTGAATETAPARPPSVEGTQSQPQPPRRHSGVEVVAVRPDGAEVDSAGVYVIAVVAGISAAATVGLIAVGIGWYNLQKHVKNASDVEYPAYGVTGPNKDLSPTSGDRRLAQSAQMYHYQHQKQQIIAMERAQPGDARHGSVSEADSDEENEEGDYTVYECPGLAPTGEMEVKNPLFQDDAQTPAAQTPAAQARKGDDAK